MSHTEDFDALISSGSTGGGDPGSTPIDAEIVNAQFWTGTADPDPISSGWWNGSGTVFGSASDGVTAANSSRLVSYGADGVSERALGLGWRGADQFGRNLSIGAQFQNNTGAAVTRLDISYEGELWYTGPLSMIGAPDTLTFEYSIDATTVLDGAATWTAVTELNFTAPSEGLGQFTAVDGNLAENRVDGISHSVTGLNIPNSSTFFIRWTNSGSHAAAIDNFSITASSGGGPIGTGPTITAISFDGTDVTLTWDSASDHEYLLEASRDLETDPWIELDDSVGSGGLSTTVTWPDGALAPPVDPAVESVLFFRVVDLGVPPGP